MVNSAMQLENIFTQVERQMKGYEEGYWLGYSHDTVTHLY